MASMLLKKRSSLIFSSTLEMSVFSLLDTIICTCRTKVSIEQVIVGDDYIWSRDAIHRVSISGVSRIRRDESRLYKFTKPSGYSTNVG